MAHAYHRALLVAALVSAGACGEVPASGIDAGWDAGDARTVDAAGDATTVDAVAPDARVVADLAGTFLVGFDTSFGPVAFAWTVDADAPASDGSYPFTATLQPLARADLTPVGSAYTVVAGRVDPTGAVTFAVHSMALPPEATGTSSTVTYSATYLAQLVDRDRLCGELPTGQITSPIRVTLDGIAWAGVRVPPGGPRPPLETACR